VLWCQVLELWYSTLRSVGRFEDLVPYTNQFGTWYSGTEEFILSYEVLKSWYHVWRYWTSKLYMCYSLVLKACHHDAAMSGPWCWRLATMMLQCLDHGTEGLPLWCCNVWTMVLKACDLDAAMSGPWCWRLTTMMLQCLGHGAAMSGPWCWRLTTMVLQCLGHGTAMSGPWCWRLANTMLQCLDHGTEGLPSVMLQCLDHGSEDLPTWCYDVWTMVLKACHPWCCNV
jgi:hypothetical protein